jgi:hypothetical protein
MKKNITKKYLIAILISFFVFIPLTTFAEGYSSKNDFQDPVIIYSGNGVGIGCNLSSDCDTYATLSCDTSNMCGLTVSYTGYSNTMLTGDDCLMSSTGAETNVGLCGMVTCMITNASANPRGTCILERRSASGRQSFISTAINSQKAVNLTPKKTFKILDPIVSLQVKIPGLDKIAAETPASCATTTENSTTCSLPWISVYIKALFNYSLGIIGILAALALMIGGLIWMTSAGNANRISQAQSWITGSLTGILIMFTSYILLNEINPALVGLKPIQLEVIQEVMPDADITTLGALAESESPFMAGCTASKNEARNIGDFANKSCPNCTYSVCAEYGSSKPAGLIAAGSSWLNQEVYTRYQQASECIVQKNGSNPFVVGQSWRSAIEQVNIKKNFEKNNKANQASWPCCSNHGSGLAMDLRRIDGKDMCWPKSDNISGKTCLTEKTDQEAGILKECMNKYGLYAELKGSPNEPWHWSPSGR